MTAKVKWTAIVLTCAKKEWGEAVQKELELRQAKGYIDKDVIVLTVEDPKSNVGSGGATINALLTVTEYISAKQGYSVINSDVLQESHILILHSGRSYPYDPCGRTFMVLPVSYTNPEYDGLITNVDLLINNISEKLAVKSGPGLWVSSTDMILSIPDNAEVPWKPCDACAITVPSTPKYCKDHGVYKIDKDGNVGDILFQRDISSLECCERPDGKVPVVPSVVYFSSAVAGKLLSFYMKPPLDACTYMGLDSGEPPIQLSLFFDVMLPMTTEATEVEFVSGQNSRNQGDKNSEIEKLMRSARALLWKELSSTNIYTCMIEEGSFHYLTNTVLNHKYQITACPLSDNFPKSELTWNRSTHSYKQVGVMVDEESSVVNSVLLGDVEVGKKSVVCGCHIGGRVVIQSDSFISGLKIEHYQTKKTIKFADAVVVQGYNIHIKSLGMTKYVLTTHGRFDLIQLPMWRSTSSFCNSPWIVMMNRTGMIKEDLWSSDIDNDSQSIMTAKLFPVFHAIEQVGLKEILWLQGQIEDKDGSILKRWRSSWRLSLQEILDLVNIEEEFHWKRQLFYDVSQRNIEDGLKEKKNIGFRSIYTSAVTDGFADVILKTLDEVAANSEGEPGVTARTLANIADVLGCMGGAQGGLRSGPAANKSWAKAFHLLEIGDLKNGIAALAKERSKWLSRPDLCIRAARHYEGAASIFIRHAVKTVKEFFKPESCELPPLGKWLTAECPARIDVSGGWSDTPPITYEHGGAVTMVALLVNGKKPVGARVKRIPELKLVFVIINNGVESSRVVCEELHDLEDYNQPYASGALLKATFICGGIIDLESSQSLSEQLQTNYGGGFEIQSWSNLPLGSGMGTSSILSAALIGVIMRAAGKSCDRMGIIHLELYVEQMMTTGGGWQDQVGGICGGIHLGLSEGKLPVSIQAVNLKVSEETVKAFNERIVLIYTGKTRLARNLLQDVVRNWYARNPLIVETEDNLVALAQECSHAFIDGDLKKVGSCLDRYWRMKKIMAPGCETQIISTLMEAVRPFALGICMAGAGGGGFMYVLAQDPLKRDVIKQLIPTVKGAEAEVYEACVDMEGLKITIEE
ncbi:L-fucose kinase-like isoform X2 [Mytilus californianus]|uniref:L-fucose kinase-like isoform X2 n=1 Tax=Mytilus californianus TaxID=6549 RepID=UPI002245CBAD|nr:L-fucose kinase-like isoform X2 [Mytilus californianus]